VLRWVYENVHTQVQITTNRKGNFIVPLNPDSFHKIYDIPNPLAFLEKFTIESIEPLELIKEWWDEETPFTMKLRRV
jgi:hypothetical protein